MSLIDDALRRAQQAASAAGTHVRSAESPARAPVLPVRDVARTAAVALHSPAIGPVASPRAADLRPARRWPSLATIILIVLGGWTFWSISQPGWGLGSDAWWLRTDGLPELAEIPASQSPARAQQAAKLVGETPISPHAGDPLYAPAQPVVRGELLRPQSPVSAAPAAATAPQPTKPAETVSPAPVPQDIARHFHLRGILLTGRTRRAVINNAILSVGDHIDGAVITAIERGSVTLTIGGEVHQLALRSTR